MGSKNEKEHSVEIDPNNVFDLDPHKVLANLANEANRLDAELSFFPFDYGEEVPELPFNPYEAVMNLDYLAARMMDAQVFVEAAEALGGNDEGSFLYQGEASKVRGKFKGFYFVPFLPYEVGGDLSRIRPSLAFLVEIGTEQTQLENPAKVRVEYNHAFFPVRSSKVHLVDLGYSANYELIDETDGFVEVVDGILEDEDSPPETVLRKIGEETDWIVQMAEPPKQHAYLALLNGAQILPPNSLILPERVFVLQNKKLSEIPADIMLADSLYFDLGALPELPDEELRVHSPVGQRLALKATFGEDLTVVVPLDQEFVIQEFDEATEEETAEDEEAVA